MNIHWWFSTTRSYFYNNTFIPLKHIFLLHLNFTTTVVHLLVVMASSIIYFLVYHWFHIWTEVGLKMAKKLNKSNDQWKITLPQTITDKRDTLDQVDEYVYCQKYHENETKCCLTIGLNTSGMNSDIVKSKMTMCMKQKVLN